MFMPQSIQIDSMQGLAQITQLFNKIEKYSLSVEMLYNKVAKFRLFCNTNRSQTIMELRTYIVTITYGLKFSMLSNISYYTQHLNANLPVQIS